MIAPLTRVPRAVPAPVWHAGFLSALPAIRSYARGALQHLSGESRDDALAEVLANVTVAYARLHQRGRANPRFARALVLYAVRQFCDGRRVGSRLNSRCLLSAYARRKHDFTVERLDRFRRDEEVWEEVLVEDATVSPAELAAIRMDFAAWLRWLHPRRRRIALALASGCSTQETAVRFGLSQGRISQLRRWFKQHWEDFQDPQRRTNPYKPHCTGNGRGGPGPEAVRAVVLCK
jgi:hypothetical protein